MSRRKSDGYAGMTSRPSTTGGQHDFSRIPKADIQRSSFNRSCGLKTTLSVGDLVPIFVDEALPGDTISMKMTSFARMGTPLFPIMDNQWLDFFWFAVPNRLLWTNWEKFNGAQDDPGDSTDFEIPTMDAPASVGYGEETLQDYLGIPTGIPDLQHSALFTRACSLIWNDWFRDENLQDSIVCDKDDGPDDPADYVVMKRGKRKDYFTSCLPWPQKGPAVTIPILDTAPITGTGSISGTLAPQFVNELGTTPVAGPIWSQGTGPENMEFGTAEANADNPLLWDDPALVFDESGLSADLTGATQATINQLRQAFQIQRLYERDARGGTRYTEILRSHFGVTSPDQRLQRPEFLGGGSTVVGINAVANVGGAASIPRGELGAFGLAAGSSGGFNKSFTEHCVIIGFCATRADLNYQQGLNRMFSRKTRWDFYWPALAHLGEQSVLNQEIYAQGPGVAGAVLPTADEETFGYQERYAEYRYKPSQTTGMMRSQSSLPLDAWHLAQDFSSLPVLNDAFIQENPPIDRVIAITDETQYILDCYFSFRHARPMPTYSVPGMIDHF